jgi:alkylation response protein AidB-like acyl-CoA dehydrogenase
MTEAAPELLRDIWETPTGRSPELWAKIAEQGLMGLSAPEADGGMGMADVDWALLLQEVGYYALPDSLTDTAYVAVGMLSALPQGHDSRVWLSRIAEAAAAWPWAIPSTLMWRTPHWPMCCCCPMPRPPAWNCTWSGPHSARSRR